MTFILLALIAAILFLALLFHLAIDFGHTVGEIIGTRPPPKLSWTEAQMRQRMIERIEATQRITSPAISDKAQSSASAQTAR